MPSGLDIYKTPHLESSSPEYSNTIRMDSNYSLRANFLAMAWPKQAWLCSLGLSKIFVYAFG